MAHFAQIDSNNVVTQVIVIDNEYETAAEKYIKETLGLDGTWVQTSYNANIRGKFAGIGDVYDSDQDAFFSPVLAEPEIQALAGN